MNEVRIFAGGYLPERTSGGGTTPTPTGIALTGYALLTYTTNTWTDVYTNASGSVSAIYLSSIINNATASRKVYMRIVASNGTDVVHDIVPETSLDGYTGIENAICLYALENGQKIQFKADGDLCECVVNIGSIDAVQAYKTTYTNATWTDLYVNNTGSTTKTKLIAVCNPQAASVSVAMRVVNSSGVLVYTMLSETGLEQQTGLENSSSKFLIDNGNKIQFRCNVAGAQFYATVGPNS